MKLAPALPDLGFVFSEGHMDRAGTEQGLSRSLRRDSGGTQEGLKRSLRRSLRGELMEGLEGGVRRDSLGGGCDTQWWGGRELVGGILKSQVLDQHQQRREQRR